MDEHLANPARSTRNRIVELHMGLASSRARSIGGGARADDDLEQVAFLALVKAIDRFDPSKGASFATFASRTVDGELKRHLRDATWAVRVPRSLKELHVSILSATTELEQRLGHSPSVGEIADELGVGRAEVLSALGAGTARSSNSLDTPEGSEGDPVGMDRQAALAVKADYEAVDNAELLEQLTADLGHRDREIIRLRFVERMSQDEIADQVGVSQMQVSRLLRRTLDQMRSSAAGDAGERYE